MRRFAHFRVPLGSAAALLVPIAFSAASASSEDPDARGVRLLAQVPLAEFPGSGNAGNDVTGYVSSAGREYAIVGLYAAVGFVEVTDPEAPVVIATFPHTGSVWADMATYRTFAYLVHDLPGSGGGDGIQVFDLSRIDDWVVEQLPSSFSGGIGTAHNVRVNAESGHLYTCGTNGVEGLWAFDLTDPGVPIFVGAWEQAASYVHDAHVVTMPSGPHAGRELAFAACGEDAFRIVDVTDKQAMVPLGGRVSYPNATYCHQVWVDLPRGLAFINDELDELAAPGTLPTSTYVLDVQDPAHPSLLTSFSNGGTAIDHNHWGRDGFLFQANYTSGLRVWDIRDPRVPREVGYFDTSAQDGVLQFRGAWGVYPSLPSGVVLVSDMQGGLFVLDASEATATAGAGARPGGRLTPNPFVRETSLELLLELPAEVQLQVFDAAGRIVATPFDGPLPVGFHTLRWAPSSAMPAGSYFARYAVDGGARVQRIVYLR